MGHTGSYAHGETSAVRLLVEVRILFLQGEENVKSELLLHDKDMKVVAQLAIKPTALYHGSGLHSLSIEIVTE